MNYDLPMDNHANKNTCRHQNYKLMTISGALYTFYHFSLFNALLTNEVKIFHTNKNSRILVKNK